jgi:hypothetical protein
MHYVTIDVSTQGHNMAKTITWTELDELGVRYCFACKNYGSSMVQFFKDDIDKLASKLIRLGVSEEALTEIYNQHVYNILPSAD